MHQALLLFFPPLLLAFYAPPSLFLWHLYANTNIQKRITVTYPNGGQSTKKKKKWGEEKEKRWEHSGSAFFGPETHSKNGLFYGFCYFCVLRMSLTESELDFFFFFFDTQQKKKKALSPLLVIYPTARTRARKHKNAGAYVCLFLPLSSPHPLPLKLIILFFLPVSKRGKKSMNFYIAASSTRAQRTRKKKSAIVFQQAYRLPLTCAWHRKALD